MRSRSRGSSAAGFPAAALVVTGLLLAGCGGGDGGDGGGGPPTVDSAYMEQQIKEQFDYAEVQCPSKTLESPGDETLCTFRHGPGFTDPNALYPVHVLRKDAQGRLDYRFEPEPCGSRFSNVSCP